MLINYFEKATSNLFAENKLLKFVVVVIAVSQVFLGYKMDRALHYQRTILVPAHLDSKVQITGDFASEDYVRSFARSVCSLAFNYSYTTARSQFGELMQWFSPEGFVTIKPILQSLAETIESTKSSSSFIINKAVKVDPVASVITVEGAQRMWVENTFIDTQQKKYLIGYQILDGKFQLTSLTESNVKEDINTAATANSQVQISVPKPTK